MGIKITEIIEEIEKSGYCVTNVRFQNHVEEDFTPFSNFIVTKATGKRTLIIDFEEESND